LTWDTRHSTLMKSGSPGGLQILFYLGRPSYYSDKIRWWRRFTYAVLLGTPVILLWWNQVVQEVCRCCLIWDTRHITLMKSCGPGGLQMLFYLGHPSYYSDEIRWSRRFVDAVLLGTLVILLWWNQVVQEVCRCCFTWDTRHITLMKSGGPGGLQMLFYLGHPSYYSDEIRWFSRFIDAVLLGTPVILLWWNQVVQEVCGCCLIWDTRHITLMKSGGPGGLQVLFYLGHPSYYSDEIRWSRRFVDAVLLGTLVILLWWNRVVQEVYRCCFTWDTRHITLMKSGGPGGLQMLFYLGHSSYYSDEIRWSRRFTDAVLLGTPVISLWWNQVVQEVCRCCFTWDTRHITLMKNPTNKCEKIYICWNL
jgi:hypothetical protein